MWKIFTGCYQYSNSPPSNVIKIPHVTHNLTSKTNFYNIVEQFSRICIFIQTILILPSI